MRPTAALLILALSSALAACGGDIPADGCDVDGDGVESVACGGDDCDDADPLVNRYEHEVCNGIDDDCDGELGAADVDEADPDGDGYLNCDPEECHPLNGEIPHSSPCPD